MRSKRITVPKPKEVSQAQKKTSQVQRSRCKGTTKEKSRPKRLEAQKKKHQERKETHGRLKKIARILSNHQEARILPGA